MDAGVRDAGKAMTPVTLALAGAVDVGRRTALPLQPNHAVQRDVLHVLFCASRDYLQHAAVAAVSLVSATPDQPIVFHVFTTESDPAAEARLTETLRPFRRIGLELYRITYPRLSRAFVDRYLTREAYLRFLAPDVLSRHVRRVIYLDCDLVVVGDVLPLWNADLRGRAVGAVAECDWSAHTGEDRLTPLGIPRGHVYVNSGVLLMDLERWRRNGLAERLLRFVEDRGADLVYHDQDALNAVLHPEITLLDRRWNAQVMMFSRWIRHALPADYHATRRARRNPGIVHYTTERKPWKFRVWTRKRALYYRHLDRTAWRHVPPPLPSAAQRLEHRVARALLKLGFDTYVLLPVWTRLAAKIRSGNGVPAKRGRTR